MFLACEFGEHLRCAYDKIECEINHLRWYRLSIELRRVLPVIILYAQEPVVMRGLGSVVCSREAFRQVSPQAKINGN